MPVGHTSATPGRPCNGCGAGERLEPSSVGEPTAVIADFCQDAGTGRLPQPWKAGDDLEVGMPLRLRRCVWGLMRSVGSLGWQGKRSAASTMRAVLTIPQIQVLSERHTARRWSRHGKCARKPSSTLLPLSRNSAGLEGAPTRSFLSDIDIIDLPLGEPSLPSFGAVTVRIMTSPDVKPPA